MERYLLLRNNCESGPFTREELKAYGLLPSDLIWVEGESTAWRYPGEIQALKAFAKNGIKQPLPATNISSSSVNSSLQEYRRALATDRPFKPADEEMPLPIFGERESNLELPKTSPKRKFALNPNLFGLGVLLIGVMLGAAILKKMVDSFDNDPVPSAAAIEIREESLPTSTTVHTAQTEATKTLPVVVEKKDTVKAKPSATVKPEKPVADAAETQAVPKNNTVVETVKMEPSPEEDAGSSSPEEISETQTAGSSPPSLRVSVNEYKVGLFGGVSDLEISVSNPSSQKVEKAVVEIEYLKPNGSVVKTQTVTVDGIAAGGSKSVPVPSSNRGVKIRYHVVSIQM